MNVITITDFRNKIGTYFDTISMNNTSLFVKKRNHKYILLSADNLDENQIMQIEKITNKHNTSTITDKSWVNTFNKITKSNDSSIILG